MRNFFISILAAVICNGAFAQASGQLTLTPANPTPGDTIYVISTLSYSGNCSYGMVYSYSVVTGNTITIMPTYCGHGIPTPCTSTDTLKIAPLGIGNYIIKIEYHQGSVCPISDFDATIGQATAAVSVNSAVVTGVAEHYSQEADLRIYPNPAQEHVFIDVKGVTEGKSQVILRNILGAALISKRVEAGSVMCDLGDLPTGIYTVELEAAGRTLRTQRLVVSD